MLPAFINLISEFSCTKEINGEPHSEQKPLDMCDPPEPVTVKYFNSHSTFSELSGIKRIVAFPLPVLF